LQGGHGRHGEAVHIAYDGNAVRAVVTPPRFVDVGERAK